MENQKSLLILTTFILIVTVNCSKNVTTNPDNASGSPLGPNKSKNCTELTIDGLAYCVDYLDKGKGTNLERPDSDCCSGFKTFLDVNATCLCEAWNTIIELGTDLDVVRAASLPSACHFQNKNVPDTSLCNGMFYYNFFSFISNLFSFKGCVSLHIGIYYNLSRNLRYP